MQFSWLFFISFLSFTSYSQADEGEELMILVLNPFSSFNIKRAEDLKRDILNQYDNNNNLLRPRVSLFHDKYADMKGSWTLLPVLQQITEECESCRVVVFIDDSSHVDLHLLTLELSKLPLNQDYFGGRVLMDASMTIVHHYNIDRDFSFAYPHISSGFFLSRPLLLKLLHKIKDHKRPTLFSLDAYYEFALLISNELDVNMTSSAFFCGSVVVEGCAVYIKHQLPQCEDFKTDIDNLVVAVKTCEKFHETRLKIVKETWGGQVSKMMYMSDKEDPSIPTIYAGTPNTDSGHCEKLMLILAKVHARMQEDHDVRWAFVADDDTLLSVPRLLGMLGCFNASEEIFLGERYGYGVSTGSGYDYITLGGGMVMSRAGLERLMGSGGCKCGSKDAPDDMVLGICMDKLKLRLTHSSHFHQARPDDYSREHITDLTPVSFHRHWAQDTMAVYKEWLQAEHESHSAKTEL